MHKSIVSVRGNGSNKSKRGTMRPSHILDEVGGQSCGFCGSQHYRLVLRAQSGSPHASLVAKCGRCDREIVGFSVERLYHDLNRHVNVDH